jgi:two-component system phosphate regulon sensor histidine kinase PhoR
VSFATRLVAGTLLVLVLTVAVLLWSAEGSLRRDLENDVAGTLESEARLIREALPGDSGAWDETVHRLSRENGRRITVVDSTGRVRADSDFPPGPLPPLENHRDRPEIRAALGGGVGRAIRRSESVGRSLL